MMLKNTLFLCLPLSMALIIVSSHWSLTKSGGPSPGYTGAPDETSCTSCHSADENTGKGLIDLQIERATAGYQAGKTYTLTLAVMDTGIVKFGFQIVALLDKDDSNAGHFNITDLARTQTNNGSDRTYINHTLSGTIADLPGKIMWQFDWAAPQPGLGPVTFYYCVNSSDNSGTTGGDKTYRKSLTLQEESASAVSSAVAAEEIEFVNHGPVIIAQYRLRVNTLVLIELYTADGAHARTLSNGLVASGNHQERYNCNDLPQGMYLLKCNTSNGQLSKKVFLQNE